ncbi:MAG: hypothetical protein ETSY1_23840 [Candidatus Entotheonella factor]|uniref:Uncharacterized protein n=1 Tax=Entotheonella factor TaxID=1429438 RepID=W4LHF0_ENTF1|nr:MAG: hypothetical protein ETSY1_23840 [Candidatus Entotheonella factor]
MIPLEGAASWDCDATDLIVNEGDLIFTGAGESNESTALGIFSEIPPRLLPDVDACIGNFFGEGATYDEFVTDTDEKQEGAFSLRSTVSVDASQEQFAGWFVSWEICDLAGDNSIVRDMSLFENGRMLLWVKTPIDLEVGIRSGNVSPGFETSKIRLSDINPLVIDDNWHLVCVPLSPFRGVAPNADFTQIKVFFVIASNVATGGTGGLPATFWVDHVRWEAGGCP